MLLAGMESDDGVVTLEVKTLAMSIRLMPTSLLECGSQRHLSTIA